MPWLTCYGWDVSSLGKEGQQGTWAFPQPVLWLAFIDKMLPLHKRASVLFGYDFLICFPPLPWLCCNWSPQKNCNTKLW